MARRAKKPQSKFLAQMRGVRDHWAKADPTSFGLSGAQVQQFGREYEQALAAHARVVQLRFEMVRAMAAKRAAFGSLRRTFGGLSSMIDGLARASDDKNVYVRAGIKKPDPKGPLPKPGEPTDLEIKPLENGQLVLTFKIDDGRGNLMYEVRRRCESLDGGESTWEPVAVTPKKKVVDNDVPNGLRSIGYQVRALRTNGKTGEWSGERRFPFGVIRGVAPGEGVGEGRAQGQVEGMPARAAARRA